MLTHISARQLERSALSDADQVRRLCCYLGSRPRLTQGERELLDRAIVALTFWDDDGEDDAQEDTFTTQIAYQALHASAQGR